MLSTLPLFYIAQSGNSDDRRARFQGLRVIMYRNKFFQNVCRIMQNLSHKAGAYFAGFAFNGREYSLLPYLETFVNDIHFQQNGCRAIPMWWHGFKTRVLHFKLR